MRKEVLIFSGHSIATHYVNTVVVGTGAAGLSAADRLWSYGCRDFVIVTEGINMGTSRNTGSDKQTYYKLTLSGGEPDSVGEMAKTLFDGGCMDGDVALAEAANSAAAFLRLCELGVDFPVNRYGEYVGYKTDHDPRRRATSIGPLTSRRMTEVLESSVREKKIKVFNRLQAVSILTGGNTARGLICLSLDAKSPESAFIAFCCKNIIWATGGPAGIYSDSVYPECHCGASGAALEAGATAKNLTEWQYGLASINPRWNVSGTYMQALPRFYSTGLDGGDEREFLSGHFMDDANLLGTVFLKGYQWPFDARKAKTGSSVIDILVYLERCVKGRRAFLDYRQNPGGGAIAWERLEAGAREYLARAGADFGLPIDRLKHMNAPAVDFYRSRGVDLEKEPLEIALCAQHNNGGLDVDAWWRTNIMGLFAVGECAGTHGVCRPGGSALNSGQVGAMRAARYIAAKSTGEADATDFGELCAKELTLQMARADAVLNNGAGKDVKSLWLEARSLMSRTGGPIRDCKGIQPAIAEISRRITDFEKEASAAGIAGLSDALRYRDSLISQLAILGAMADYVSHKGKSRGSALYTEPSDKGLSFVLDDAALNGLVQTAEYRDSRFAYSWRPVRPLPEEDDFFENVWREFREDGNVR